MKLRMVFLAAALLALPAVAGAGNVCDAYYRLYHLTPGGPVRVLSNAPLPPGSNVPPNNQWRYEYEVMNKSTVGGTLGTFYAFFNSTNLDLAHFVSGTMPASWTVLQQGPVAPNYNYKVRYRTTSSGAMITSGNKLICTATFNWTGSTTPGPQNYDIVVSGGSEPGVTVEIMDLTPTAPMTWGRLKRDYR
ncbi:MAG: hypothetical protein HZB25_05575 [Candidatus Eisenbacteria bacterium]|nr:hypothetical protein [Candidatus Eisenbacteria bacterium]